MVAREEGSGAVTLGSRFRVVRRAGPLVSATLGLLGGALALASACVTERVNPLVDSGTGGQESGSSSSQGGAGGSLPVKRTVLTRHPFGNVAASDNLLWDGDFEWLSGFADQYAWLAGKTISSIGYQLPKQVIGARCKSGVKCVELKPKAVVVGYAVASAGNPLEASVHVRLDGDCATISVALVSLDDSDPNVPLAPEAERIDGFCRYAGTSKERSSSTWLFVQNKSTETVIVDDAIVRRVGQMSLSAAPPLGAALTASELVEVRRALREHAKPNPRPRDVAEERFLIELERRRSE